MIGIFSLSNQIIAAIGIVGVSNRSWYPSLDKMNDRYVWLKPDMSNGKMFRSMSIPIIWQSHCQCQCQCQFFDLPFCQWQFQCQFFSHLHVNSNGNINFFITAVSMAMSMTIFFGPAYQWQFQCQFSWKCLTMAMSISIFAKASRQCQWQFQFFLRWIFNGNVNSNSF